MTRKERINSLLSRLDELEAKTSDEPLSEAIAREQADSISVQIKSSPAIKRVDALMSDIKKMQSGLKVFAKKDSVTKLMASLGDVEASLRDDMGKSGDNLLNRLQALSDSLNESVTSVRKELSESAATQLDSAVSHLESSIASVVTQLTDSIEKVNADIVSRDTKRGTEIAVLQEEVNRTGEDVKNIVLDAEKARRDFMDKLASIHIPDNHGGNANRNISVGGNPSVLSKYTDINFKAGSNVTLTYANNDTTKQVDLTIAASGGGSSVSGITRSINRVSASATMGNTSGTDYVYIATAGIALTLPDATGLTNLFTIKNIAASSVLVATTGAQTIDGDTSLILATQYTAVDIINDGNDNWSIT